MICATDIPQSYEPGRFHLLPMGLFTTTIRNTIVGFCGLQKHGGTPPIAPPGAELSPSAVRSMFVLYPPERHFLSQGDVIMPVAPLPSSALFSVAPEMHQFKDRIGEGRKTEQTTLMSDGFVISEDLSLFNSFARAQLFLADWVRRQLPPHLSGKISVDANAFLNSFCLRSEDGNSTERPGAWAGAPRQLGVPHDEENWDVDVALDQGATETRRHLATFTALASPLVGLSDAKRHEIWHETWRKLADYRTGLLLLPQGETKRRVEPKQTRGTKRKGGESGRGSRSGFKSRKSLRQSHKR